MRLDCDDRHRRFERWRCACPRPRPPCTPTRTPPYGEAGLNSVLPVTKVSERNQSQSSHKVIKQSRKVHNSPEKSQKSFLSHSCLPHARKTLHTTTRHDPQQSDRVPKSSCRRI